MANLTCAHFMYHCQLPITYRSNLVS